jgi:DNA-binding MarR family transcriptional regulator
MTSEPPLPLRFDGCLATNLEQAFRHLEQVYERLIAPTGLTLLEWYVLRALYEQDGLTASHLAALVCRHPSSMTAVLDRMEEKGLLRRQIDAADRRVVHVFLTERGRAFRPQVEAVAAHLDRVITESLSAEQLATFRYVLSVLQNIELSAS